MIYRFKNVALKASISSERTSFRIICFKSKSDCDTPPVAEIILVVGSIVILDPASNLSCFPSISLLVRLLPFALLIID